MRPLLVWKGVAFCTGGVAAHKHEEKTTLESPIRAMFLLSSFTLYASQFKINKA
jgi:hypothetical protein